MFITCTQSDLNLRSEEDLIESTSWLHFFSRMLWLHNNQRHDLISEVQFTLKVMEPFTSVTVRFRVVESLYPEVWSFFALHAGEDTVSNYSTCCKATINMILPTRLHMTNEGKSVIFGKVPWSVVAVFSLTSNVKLHEIDLQCVEFSRLMKIIFWSFSFTTDFASCHLHEPWFFKNAHVKAP